MAFSDDELIYLDPHTTQQAVDTESGGAVDDQSYHCQRTPHRMKITSLDPSVALVRAQSTSMLTEKLFRLWHLAHRSL